MNHKKEVILSILGIVCIVVGAYLTSSLVYQEKHKQEVKKEEPLKVGNTKINLKLYRINQSFFIKVPDTFLRLDEATLLAKYGTTNRPELVFQSEDDQTHIYVTVRQNALTEEELGSYVLAQKEALTTLNVMEADTYTSYGKMFGRLVALDQNETGRYYDIRYFIIDSNFVTVEFHTNNTMKQDWKKASEAILKSICFREEDTKKQ